MRSSWSVRLLGAFVFLELVGAASAHDHGGCTACQELWSSGPPPWMVAAAEAGGGGGGGRGGGFHLQALPLPAGLATGAHVSAPHVCDEPKRTQIALDAVMVAATTVSQLPAETRANFGTAGLKRLAAGLTAAILSSKTAAQCATPLSNPPRFPHRGVSAPPQAMHGGHAFGGHQPQAQQQHHHHHPQTQHQRPHEPPAQLQHHHDEHHRHQQHQKQHLLQHDHHRHHQQQQQRRPSVVDQTQYRSHWQQDQETPPQGDEVAAIRDKLMADDLHTLQASLHDAGYDEETIAKMLPPPSPPPGRRRRRRARFVNLKEMMDGGSDSGVGPAVEVGAGAGAGVWGGSGEPTIRNHGKSHSEEDEAETTGTENEIKIEDMGTDDEEHDGLTHESGGGEGKDKKQEVLDQETRNKLFKEGMGKLHSGLGKLFSAISDTLADDDDTEHAGSLRDEHEFVFKGPNNVILQRVSKTQPPTSPPTAPPSTPVHDEDHLQQTLHPGPDPPTTLQHDHNTPDAEREAPESQTGDDAYQAASDMMRSLSIGDAASLASRVAQLGGPQAAMKLAQSQGGAAMIMDRLRDMGLGGIAHAMGGELGVKTIMHAMSSMTEVPEDIVMDMESYMRKA